MKLLVGSKSRLLLGLLIFLAGFIIGAYFSQNNSVSNLIDQNTDQNATREIRLGSKSGYKYINPLLECDSSSSIGEQEYRPSKKAIETIIDNGTENNTLIDAAVYYRDLNNGPWFGVNAQTDFAPASLLKLPVMMTLLKKAENNLPLLKQKIKYSKPSEGLLSQNFITAKPFEVDKEYSIEELIEKMIINSDNDALRLLDSFYDQKSLEKLQTDIGIEIDTSYDPSVDYMSVQSYASLFRVMFNASYLTPEMSEKALGILSQSKFIDGLAGGIKNKNITVAHKFGERFIEEKDIRQLHDCGIVYYPKHPYLLCVMTKGRDFNTLAQTIRAISRQIYEDINQKYKTK